VRTLCEGCDGQVRTDAPARWRESLTFLRLTAGPTATDGAHPGCDGGATPGSHPSQPETQGILRLSAHRARTSVRRVRRVGSHPDELKNLRTIWGFPAAKCDGQCELRTRNHGLSLAKYRAAPPLTRLGVGRTRNLSELTEASARQRRFCSPSRTTEIAVKPSAAAKNRGRRLEHHSARQNSDNEKPAAVPRAGSCDTS
jgi:hypothetical protein